MQVFHDVPAEDDDTDINELIHTHSTASSDVAAHGSHHHAAGIPTLQSPSANTGALDAVQSHPGHAGADSADGNALSPAAVHAAGRALETALLHAAVQSTVSAVQPMVGDAAAGPLQGMGSPPGRMRLAAAAAAAGLGAVPPTPLPRRLKRKVFLLVSHCGRFKSRLLMHAGICIV